MTLFCSFSYEAGINGADVDGMSVLRFTGISSYSYTDQRKVETDAEVTEDRTADLLLCKPRTNQLMTYTRSRILLTILKRQACISFLVTQPSLSPVLNLISRQKATASKFVDLDKCY